MILVGLVIGGSVIQVCKFILDGRDYPHVGRGNAEVHFVRISLILHRLTRIRLSPGGFFFRSLGDSLWLHFYNLEVSFLLSFLDYD